MSVTELGQSQGMAWARSAGSSFAGNPIAELQEWLGGESEPRVTYHLEVTSYVNDPTYRFYENHQVYWISDTNLKCKLVGSDGSEETINLKTDPRAVVSPADGAAIPAGTKTIAFHITLTLEGGEKVTWDSVEHPVDPDHIIEIEAEPCDPEWSPEGTITELQLPPATAMMASGMRKRNLTTAQLIELASPSTVAVEVRYRGAAPETVQLNGSTAVIHGMKGEAPCALYSYSIDGRPGREAPITPPSAEPEPPEPPTPVSLEATTGEGWKSSYGIGEKLSLEGLTLTINYSDGSSKSFQRPFGDDGAWSFTPPEGSEFPGPTKLYCIWSPGNNYLYTTIDLSYTGPGPGGLSVEGPTRKKYAVGEQLSLDGLVVKAQVQQPDGGTEEVSVPEKIGDVTDGYEMMLDGKYFTSEALPAAFTEAGDHTLYVIYEQHEAHLTLRWRPLQPAITSITRPAAQFEPHWGLPPEIMLDELPYVNARLENGEVRERLMIDILLRLAEPRTLFIESRYEGLEQTVVVNAADDRAMLKGVVNEHGISAYRYLYGSTQDTAEPVSDWLAITPPSGYGPTA